MTPQRRPDSAMAETLWWLRRVLFDDNGRFLLAVLLVMVLTAAGL